MRSNSIGVESNIGHNRTYSTTVLKSSGFNNNSNKYYNVKVVHHVNSADNFNDVNSQKISNEYEIENESQRRSRQQDTWEDNYLYGNKVLVKRDHSMPPVSGRERKYIDDTALLPYPLSSNMYSFDGNLDIADNNFDDTSTIMYDSILTNVSVTPPPVQMVHEYNHKKAIIRPLAFRPVQSDRTRGVSESSPTKPPVVGKNRVNQVRRVSPPPVPPHSARLPLKTNIFTAQSLTKSGDSSGYYSGRTACTGNGNRSSTDLSPTLDENGSMMDSVTTMGDIYVNTADLIDGFPLKDVMDQGDGRPHDLESEIFVERERNKFLEAALSKSSAKLINAECQIIELKSLLSQRSSEINSTKENLAQCKRSLEHQNQRTHNLEVSIQSIKYDRDKEKVTKEKMTQTNTHTGDNATNTLLEQFEDERRTWFDQKLKVLTYQKQVETNFQKLVIKSRCLEAQLGKLKSQSKDGRSQPSHLLTNHSDDQEKSSLTSADSSGRNHVTNIHRIESTDHQASF